MTVLTLISSLLVAVPSRSLSLQRRTASHAQGLGTRLRISTEQLLEQEGPACRICFSSGSPEELVRPCACADPVHLRCLEQWQESRVEAGRAAMRCEVCQQPYKGALHHGIPEGHYQYRCRLVLDVLMYLVGGSRYTVLPRLICTWSLVYAAPGALFAGLIAAEAAATRGLKIGLRVSKMMLPLMTVHSWWRQMNCLSHQDHQDAAHGPPTARPIPDLAILPHLLFSAAKEAGFGALWWSITPGILSMALHGLKAFITNFSRTYIHTTASTLCSTVDWLVWYAATAAGLHTPHLNTAHTVAAFVSADAGAAAAVAWGSGLLCQAAYVAFVAKVVIPVDPEEVDDWQGQYHLNFRFVAVLSNITAALGAGIVLVVLAVRHRHSLGW